MEHGTRTQEETMTTVERIKVLTGYAAHARFLVDVSDEPIGEIPRQIPTPYAQ